MPASLSFATRMQNKYLNKWHLHICPFSTTIVVYGSSALEMSLLGKVEMTTIGGTTDPSPVCSEASKPRGNGNVTAKINGTDDRQRTMMQMTLARAVKLQ